MAKGKNIKIEFNTPVWVIGIASNERIWKLCWELNKELDLNLTTGSRDLIQAGAGEFYLDQESFPNFEYCLLENNFKKKSQTALARQFRYWLVIKPYQEAVPEIEAIMGNLKEISSISLAVDLSKEKEINKILPWI